MNVKDIFKYVLIAGLIAVLFIPFVVADSQLFPFITGKAFTFRILIEVIFGIWLIAMFRDPDLRPRFSWVMGSVLIFAVVTTAADVFGVNLYRSFWSNFERMDGLVSLLHLFAYFFVAGSVLNTRAKWHAFFNISVFSSVIMAFYAFLQLTGKITINQGGVRVDGTFGNATYLAVFMLFNFFLVLLLSVRAYQNVPKKPHWLLFGWYGLAAVCQLIVLYHTATRGAILGLVGGLLLTSFVIAVFGKSQPVFRKMAVGVLCAVVLLVGGFFAVRNSDFISQSPTLSRFASLSIEEISTQGRRYVWPMAVSGFLEKPILGWGQENFSYVFSKYYDPRMYSQEPWFDHAHNIVLDWLVSGGLLGLLSYLGLFASLLMLIWKNQTMSLVEKSILIGLTAAYFFQNLFVFDNLISYIYFFSLLAFVHSENSQTKAVPVWLTNFSKNVFLTQRVLPVLVVVGVAVSVYGLNVKPIQANRSLIRGLSFNQYTPAQSLEHFKKVYEYGTFADGEATEQLSSQFQKFASANVDSETKQNYAALATEKFKLQIDRFPNDVRTLLFMGGMRNRLGDFDDALMYLNRAEKISPKKQSILFEIGLSHLSKGDYPKALEVFRNAYELAPDYIEARILYAVAAIYNKNSVLTNELLAPVRESRIVSEERIIAAYAGSGQISEAVKLVEKRLVLEPENPEIYLRLSAGYLELGQRAKSLEMLRVVVNLSPKYRKQAEYYIKEIQAGRNP